MTQKQPRRFVLGIAATLLLTSVITACGGSASTSGEKTTPAGDKNASTAANTAKSGPPDLAEAKKEGTLVVLHGDQENDVVEFLKKFTEKTGIKAEQQRLLPGAALPKLEAAFKQGSSNVDVWMNSDMGIMYDQMKRDHLLKYESPEMKEYEKQYKSNPEGFYTTYFLNVGTIMYNPKFVKPEEAPKTWTDLVDPKWKGQVGFQDASAGTQYNWWYLMKDTVPKDYFDRLDKNQPKAYSSSTQQLNDMLNGSLKIGGKVSSYQAVKAMRQGQQITIVNPPEGVAVNPQVVGIMADTKRSNAAKVFVDYFLSKEGQEVWNNIQGSYSARPDVKIKELDDIKKLKLLTPTNVEDYASTTKHKEFVDLWTRITGLH
jgi:iron(III) transport system substrate-binding protein